MQWLPHDTGMEPSQRWPEAYRGDLWIEWKRLSGELSTA